MYIKKMVIDSFRQIQSVVFGPFSEPVDTGELAGGMLLLAEA